MLIRREQPRDVETISAVITAAFRRAPDTGKPPDAGEPPEAELVIRLRVGDDWLPRLSLVAVVDGAVIGHVLCTRGFVDDAPALGLGPISVLPSRQGTGAGHALMHAVLGAAEATDEGVVCLVGEPAFYDRFGFRPAAELGIITPDPSWGSYFQARTLSGSRGLAGAFRYAREFAELGLG